MLQYESDQYVWMKALSGSSCFCCQVQATILTFLAFKIDLSLTLWFHVDPTPSPRSIIRGNLNRTAFSHLYPCLCSQVLLLPEILLHFLSIYLAGYCLLPAFLPESVHIILSLLFRLYLVPQVHLHFISFHFTTISRSLFSCERVSLFRLRLNIWVTFKSLLSGSVLVYSKYNMSVCWINDEKMMV